jgi:hypothetical protein
VNITWRNIDASGRRFNFETSNLVLGELTLFGPFLSNAHYYTSQGGIRFNKNGSTSWPNRMLLEKNGETVGALVFRLYKSPSLVLKNGKHFLLECNLFGRNLRWINAEGDSVVSYTDPTMQSMGRGSISLSGTLSREEADLLISTGIVARNYFTHRLSITAFLVGFAFLSAVKLLA